MIIGELYMKFFEENYSQEIPTRIKNLRKKYNITQSELWWHDKRVKRKVPINFWNTKDLKD